MGRTRNAGSGNADSRPNTGTVERPPLTQATKPYRVRKDANREAACRRIGLTTVPPTSPAVTRLMQSIPGGKSAFMDYAHFSTEAKIKAVCEMWDSRSKSDKGVLQITDLCAALDVPFKTLLSEVTAIMYEQNSDISRIIAAVNHPEIVAKTIKFAKTKAGVADRKMLHDHANFTPVPKGTTIINRFQQLNQQNSITPPTDKHSLPQFEQDTVLFGKAERGELLLEAGTTCEDNESAPIGRS